MTRARRFVWLRRVAIAVLAVLLLAMALVGWLLATPSGARFVVARLPGVVPGELTIGRADGTLLGTLSLTGVEYRIGETRVALGALDVRVAPGVLFNFRQVTVRELSLRGVDVTYPAAGQEPQDDAAPAVAVPAIDVPALPVSIDVEAFDARDIAVGAAGADEPLRVDRVALAGRYDGTEITLVRLDVGAPLGELSVTGALDLAAGMDATLDVDWALAGETAPRGRLALDGDRARYAVEHELEAPYAVRTDGTVAVPVDAPLRFALTNRADRVTLRAGERTFAFDGIVASIEGRIHDWSASADTRMTGAGFEDAAVAIAARGDLADVTVSSLTVRDDDATRLQASGAIGGWPDADWRVAATLDDLALAPIVAAVDAAVSGDIVARGRLGARPEVRAQTEGIDGRWRDYELAAAGAVEWRPGSLALESVRASAGDNAVDVDGTLLGDAGADLRFDVRASALGQLLPELDGALFAEGRFAGSPRAPEIDARLTVPTLAWRELDVADASGAVTFAAGEGGTVDLALDAARVTYGARQFDTVRVRADGVPGDHRIALSANGAPVRSLRVAAAGGYADGGWAGRLDALELAVRPVRAARDVTLALEAPADLSIGPGRLRVGRACLAGAQAPSVCAEAAIDQSTIDVMADVADVALAVWLPPPPLAVDVSGTGRGTLRLAGPRDRLSGEARVVVDGLTLSRTIGDGTESLAFTETTAGLVLDDGLLDVDALVRPETGGALRADIAFGDVYADDADLQGRLALDVPDVTAFNTLFDKIRFSEGAVVAEATLAGRRRAPVISSSVDASAIRARLLPLGIEVRDVRINAESDGATTLSYSGGGRSGDGQFDLRGETKLAAGEALATTATITADRFTFLALPDRHAVASMDLDVTASRRRAALSGTLSVDEADILVRELPAGAVGVSDDVRVVDPAGTVSEVRVPGMRQSIDVDVTLADDVHLEGFGLSTDLEGSLSLRKRPTADLLGFGTLAMRDAAYTAYGQRLEVTRGRLVFNGPLDSPVLDVRAERTVDDTVVGIEIGGTPDALSSTLFSEPALPEAETFSLLLTGRSLSAAGQGGDTALADAALTLGLRQAFGVSSAIRDAFGLDTLTVAGSGRDGRLLAGKQLSERLYLQYAYGVFDQVSTVLLRLQINDRLALESSSGDTQSVDLVYSVGGR